jgi:hypothetical protein
MEPYAATQEARKLVLEVASELKKLRLDDPSLAKDRDDAVKACEDAGRKLAGVGRDTPRDQLTKFVDTEIHPVAWLVGRVARSASMLLRVYQRGNAEDLMFRSPDNLAHLRQVVSWMGPIEKRMKKATDVLERATGRHT